jgi:hypothetical protein
LFGRKTWLIAVIWLAACTTTEPKDRYGIQSQFSSLIPARIAVLPCRTWPQTSRYESMPMTAWTPDDQTAICNRFDEFVLDGFKNQPFMRGFSPKAVLKLLENSQQTSMLKEIEMLWRPANVDCQTCRTPMSFYQTAVASQQLWRLWLAQLSRATRNSDAVLVPFALYHKNDTYDDRGLRVARRSLAVVLLLIDTGSGNLIWSGGRESYASTISAPDAVATPPAAPPLGEVLDRVFVEDVWKEFPGRLFLQ